MAHALTLRNDFLREHSTVLTVSVLVHLALFVLLSLNLNLFPQRQPRPSRLAIQATVVDAKAMRRRAADEDRRQRQAQQADERRRQQELERQQRVAEQREDERRLAEQKVQDQTEVRRRETARREQAAAKLRQAKAAQQRQEAELKQQATADAQRQAEAQRRKAQTQADLARQMAEEEELFAAEDSGLLDQYAEIIRQKVERNWIRPASAREGINCVVLVKQIPGGDVIDVRVAECNGDAAVVRSIEAAVLRSSPLPPPPDPSLFDRSLRFDFRPRD
jgi:colicin import membrane protein